MRPTFLYCHHSYPPKIPLCRRMRVLNPGLLWGLHWQCEKTNNIFINILIVFVLFLALGFKELSAFHWGESLYMTATFMRELMLEWPEDFIKPRFADFSLRFFTYALAPFLSNITSNIETYTISLIGQIDKIHKLLLLGKISSYMMSPNKCRSLCRIYEFMSAPTLYSDYSLHTDWAREFFEKLPRPLLAWSRKMVGKLMQLVNTVRTLVYTDDRYPV